jgi:hypothetical protein
MLGAVHARGFSPISLAPVGLSLIGGEFSPACPAFDFIHGKYFDQHRLLREVALCEEILALAKAIYIPTISKR